MLKPIISIDLEYISCTFVHVGVNEIDFTSLHLWECTSDMSDGLIIELFTWKLVTAKFILLFKYLNWQSTHVSILQWIKPTKTVLKKHS